MDELKEKQAVQWHSMWQTKETDNWMVSELNKDIYWTGWYAVSGNKIQWTTDTRDTMNNEKKSK